LQQISGSVFCDDFIAGLKLETRLVPNPYHNFPYLVIENFLPPLACIEIAASVRASSEAETAKVKSALLDSVVVPALKQDIRKTKIYKLPKLYEHIYTQRFLEHQGKIEQYFNLALTTATKVQVLEYTKGSFYIKHADDSNDVVDDKGRTVGFVPVAPQRKLTTVLFVTGYDDTADDMDHFRGGELLFNYLYDESGEQVMLRPKAGDMVVFPSNPLFSHEVLPVIAGYRLTLVQWHNAIIN
jgi:SM-20-related protein